MSFQPWCHWRRDTLVLRIRVQPRAARDEVVGPHGGALKVRICAPPLQGRANAHLCRFLAGEFDVPARQVTVVRGASSRNKQVTVAAPRRLPPWLPPAPRDASKAGAQGPEN